MREIVLRLAPVAIPLLAMLGLAIFLGCLAHDAWLRKHGYWTPKDRR